jgi:hypothetical protein
MRLWKLGLGGGDAPKSVVGFRANPPRPNPCPPPPRAKLGVDPTTQAAANTLQKRECGAMAASPQIQWPLVRSGPAREILPPERRRFVLPPSG